MYTELEATLAHFYEQKQNMAS